MTRELQRRVANVTGVSRRHGIALAIARRLASMGAALFFQSYAPYEHIKRWGENEQTGDGMVLEFSATGARVETLNWTSQNQHPLQNSSPAPPRCTAITLKELGRYLRQSFSYPLSAMFNLTSVGATKEILALDEVIPLS